jgi:hypothetical protein
MSLLLDARKKSQQANSAQAGDGSHAGLELSLEPHPDSASQSASATVPPDSSARAAGQNLFNAKSRGSSITHPGINRNLLFALVGTVVLLGAGAGYVWYAISAGNTQRTVVRPSVARPAKPAAETIQPKNNLVPEVASTVTSKPAATRKPVHAKASVKVARANKSSPVIIEQHQDEPIDPILNSAYLAYRSGNLDQAQQLYLRAHNLPSHNVVAMTR